MFLTPSRVITFLASAGLLPLLIEEMMIQELKGKETMTGSIV